MSFSMFHVPFVEPEPVTFNVKWTQSKEIIREG